MTDAPRVPAPATAAEAVAAAILAHPAVARLAGGPFGTVASYLPGRRRLVGVRVGSAGGPTEIAVVARFGIPGISLPALAGELGVLVRAVLGPVPVEITFADVVVDAADPG
ncbi:hypothetical protein [Pseudonocardia sp. H11422]|uniref:hypothetical protein n=1 Tax=Pseudonocardia sp. H11422 TaxID=2835866 RepID=UPI001BDD7080|nr:hypothetical protein [Pseudonocardia sp. H11422]